MKASPLVLYLPDTRGVQLSRFGSGNAKIGFGVFTYSRMPGSRDHKPSMKGLDVGSTSVGTCPGATPECEEICYAKRVDQENGVVRMMWVANSIDSIVPLIPEECSILRLHISGDFDTVGYIEQWIARLTARPDVTCWAYTKSWRVPHLRAALERLRMLPNMQLFASMDASADDDPNVGELATPFCKTCGMEASNPQHLVECPDNAGAHDFVPFPWRRAWIHRTFDQSVATGRPMESRLTTLPNIVYDKQEGVNYTHTAMTHFMPAGPSMIGDSGVTVITPSYVCPEETGYKKDCLTCGYCFEGKRNDVTFLEH